MNGGCGCGGAAPAGSAGPQAILPLRGVLSPLISASPASLPTGPSIAVTRSPSLAATPEAQSAALAQVFAGQTGAQPAAAKKSNTGTWVVIGAVGAALAMFL